MAPFLTVDCFVCVAESVFAGFGRGRKCLATSARHARMPRRRERCVHCGSRHVEYAYRRVAACLREGFKRGSLRIKLAVFFGALPIALECVERLMRFRIRLPAAAREKIGALVFDEPRHIGWRISKNESDFVGEPRFALRRFELLSGKCRLRSALANMVRPVVVMLSRGAAWNEPLWFRCWFDVRVGRRTRGA